VRARAVDAAYALGWALVKALPERVALALFHLGGGLAARRRGPAVRQLEANLARVVPGQTEAERRALTRAAMRSYARYWCEVFRLPVMSRERVLDHFAVGDEPAWEAALAASTGVVLALPHQANWDIAGAYCVHRGRPFATVAERLEPAALFDRFVAFREQIGMEVVPAGDRTSVVRLMARLRAGGNLCLVADRDLSRHGVPVTFFGEPTRMPAGPAQLALKTGAALFPVTLRNTRRGWHATIHPALAHTDVATMTQQLADAFATGIAEAPQDWHMLQPLWLADLA
jgi:KDO2-lipid IV(A) lauroyltransferase